MSRLGACADRQLVFCLQSTYRLTFSPGHLLTSVLERGFILIRHVFGPAYENVSRIVNGMSPSWLSGLSMTFEKYTISVLFSTAIIKAV